MTPPDLATLLTRFSDLLRGHGVSVSPDQTMRLATMVELGIPRTVDELYWCARVSLLRSVADLSTFDRMFALVFRGLVDVAESRGDENAPRAGGASVSGGLAASAAMMVPALSPGTRRRDGGGPGQPIPALASDQERLTSVDFASLSSDELAVMAPLLHALAMRPPLRVSRRRRRHRRGDRLDVRATIRHSTRSGGDPVAAIRRTRKERPRRIVALLDISGSMEPYSRAYLHLLWGAVTRARAEVFVFATRLTRLTTALRHGNPDVALDRAAALMPDWSGGTRIGAAVREFMDRYGRRGMAHGAVVLVVSDGWERADPALLRRQMSALSLRAHRVVWANPRTAAPGFEPLAGGMAAALPSVDALVSGHSTEALAEVLDALSA
jgi:uncharacterized protein with von Willebrand factor type A (vWA) domain